jgi:hypothetical protein
MFYFLVPAQRRCLVVFRFRSSTATIHHSSLSCSSFSVVATLRSLPSCSRFSVAEPETTGLMDQARHQRRNYPRIALPLRSLLHPRGRALFSNSVFDEHLSRVVTETIFSRQIRSFLRFETAQVAPSIGYCSGPGSGLARKLAARPSPSNLPSCLAGHAALLGSLAARCSRSKRQGPLSFCRGRMVSIRWVGGWMR